MAKLIGTQDILEGKDGLAMAAAIQEVLKCSRATFVDWMQQSDSFPRFEMHNGKPHFKVSEVLFWLKHKPPSKGPGQDIRNTAIRLLGRFPANTPNPYEGRETSLANTATGAAKNPKSAATRLAELEEKGLGNNFDAQYLRQGLAMAAGAPAKAVPAPSAPSPAPTAAVIPEVVKSTRLDPDAGLRHALTRLQQAELSLGLAFKAQLDEGDPGAAATFRMWKDAIDQLRKTEGEIEEIELTKGKAIPIDEAKKAVATIVSAVTSRLKLFPSQIAHELADRDAAEVQEILHGHVTSLLDGLAKAVKGSKTAVETPKTPENTPTEGEEK